MSKLSKIFSRSFITALLICLIITLGWNSLWRYGSINEREDYVVKSYGITLLKIHLWFILALTIINLAIIWAVNHRLQKRSIKHAWIASVLLALILPLLSIIQVSLYVRTFPEKEFPPKPWHFEFSEVRAYRINWDNEFSSDSIRQEKELNPTRIPKEGTVLSEQQIKKLRHAICNQRSGGATGMCRYPHHALIFYSANGDIVGHFDICFMCNNSGGLPEGFAHFPDHGELKKLFTSLGIPITNPKWDNTEE